MAKRKTTLDRTANVPALGRVLAVLRATLNLTQSDLARRSKVKRASISEYERGVTNPDASTLARLLEAMGFRWSALDFGAWFIAHLKAECGTKGTLHTAQPVALKSIVAEATKLRASAAAVSTAAERVGCLAKLLEAQGAREGHLQGALPEGLGRRPTPEDRTTARALWARAATLPRTRQEEALRTAPTEVAWALSELLALESQGLCGDDPLRAASLAELALSAASRVGGDAWSAKLQGFAWAHIGNARRAHGDLREADRAFTTADPLWEAGAAAPWLVLEDGMFFFLKASLRRAQRRFDEAADLLEHALRVARSETFRVKVLGSKAKLLEERGELQEAVAILRELKDMTPQDAEGRVLYWIRHNLADNLSKLGRFEEASALLPEARTLCVQYGGELNLVRVLWTEGRVTAGLGDTPRGIETLTRVRGEFASRSMGYDMALASLELAVFYTAAGRLDEVKTLARHMVPIFQAQDVHREGLAALTLFRQAAEGEIVTVEFCEEILNYLRKARHNPDLKFAGPA